MRRHRKMTNRVRMSAGKFCGKVNPHYGMRTPLVVTAGRDTDWYLRAAKQRPRMVLGHTNVSYRGAYLLAFDAEIRFSTFVFVTAGRQKNFDRLVAFRRKADLGVLRATHVERQ